MENGVFDWDETPERSRPVPDKHLALPIIVSLIHRFEKVTQLGLERYRTDKYPGRMSSWGLTRSIKDACRDDENLCYGALLEKSELYVECTVRSGELPLLYEASDYPEMFKRHLVQAPHLTNDLNIASSVAKHEIDAYCTWIADIIKPKQLKAYRDALTSRVALSEETIHWYKVSSYWSLLCDKSRRAFDKPLSKCSTKLGPSTYTFWKGYFTCETPEKRSRVGVFEQLQMLQDAARARFNVFLAIDLKMHHGSARIKEHFRNQLEWQEQCLIAYGNEGYAFAKYPEAVYKSRLTLLSKGDVLPRSSYDRTFDKIGLKEAALDVATPLTKRLKKLADAVDNLGDCAELFGLCKLSGHPSVYADFSGKAVQKAATSKDHSLPRSIVKLHRAFRHLFIAGYLERHESWPPFVRPPRQGTRLHRHWMNNATVLPVNSYDPSDLDDIWFAKLKTIHFDYHEDYLQFLDDKALSVGADRSATFWYGNSVPSAIGTPERKRRLLLQLLGTEKVDTVEIVDRMRQGHFHSHERIVELTQKEREFKIAARCFAKMCFEVRLFWVILESNSANFMDLYFPQQTMTMSEASQKKRLYDMVKNWNSPDRAQLEVDFTTWNNRWNKWTCDPIARDMEALFGMPGAWSQVHDFFTKATIVVTDKNMLPPGASPHTPVSQWPTSDLLWRGTHIGGLEGIQQKFWTICTIAMMYYALHDQPVSFIMAGQGDNHVFTLYFDTSRGDMAATLTKLLAVMEIRCATLNHEVKPEECIDSRTVLTYSKELYICGVQQQYCLKFASRAFWLDDKSTPSLSKEVSGVMACSQMCADTAPNQMQAVTWKHILLRLMFRERSAAAGTAKEAAKINELLDNQRLYTFVTLLPGSLGGLPTAPWTRFFMKGEVDDLSWDVAGTIRTAAYIPALGHDLKNLMRGKYTPATIDLTQLVSDPHSIPVERPTDRTELIKKAVQSSSELLCTKNAHIKGIMETCKQDVVLKEALAHTSPLFPDIMSDLYSWSPSGLRENILGRFNKTRTLADVTRGRFTSDVNNANVLLLDSIFARFKAVRTTLSFSTDKTPFEVCQKLRDLWKCGLKNADIGSYTPFEFPLTYDLGKTATIMVGVGSNATQCAASLGSQSPNFGTKTRAKVSEHGFRVYTSGSAVRDLKGIVLTASELGSSTRLLDLCDQLSAQRSPWSARTLSSVLPTAFGGCASHRHSRLSQAHFAILGSKTVPTHVSLCSDKAGQLSGGFYDYPVAFQAFYLTGTALIQQLAPMGMMASDSWFGFSIPTRMEPISDSDVTAPQLNLPTVDLRANPLAYTTKILSSSVPDIPDPSQIPHLRNPAADQRSLVYSAMLDLMLSNKRLMSHVNTVAMPIDIMDLKEFLCCTPTILLEATSAAICAVGFSKCATKKKPDMVRAEAEIMRLCEVMGGYIARLFAHPMASASATALMIGAVCVAGRGGATISAQRTADYLRRACSGGILFKQWRNNLKLLLFADHRSDQTNRVFAHGLLMCSMQATQRFAYRITDDQISLLKRITTYMTGDDAASSTMRVAACLAWMARTIDKKYSATTPGVMRSRYVRVPAAQALRELRSRKVRVKPLKPNPLAQLTKAPTSGTYSIDRSLSGICQRTCSCADESDHVLRADLALQSSRRQIGSYSALTSDWHAILRCSGVDPSISCICIGVGHGGSARAALSLGIVDVVGLDRRSSFPDIPQREGSYVPPEVLASGLSQNFSWHKHVWRKGGDVFRWKGETRFSTLILDIDADYQTTMRALVRCRGEGTILVRTRCCPHELETLIDAIRPSHIWKLSVRHDIVRPSVVLVGDREMLNLESASGYRVTVKTLPTLDYSCRAATKKELKTYIGYLLHICYSQPGITQNDLANEVTRLRLEAGTPGIDPSVRRRLLDAADTLVDTIRALGKLHIDISYDLRHLRKHALRIAGRLDLSIFRDKGLPVRTY